MMGHPPSRPWSRSLTALSLCAAVVFAGLAWGGRTASATEADRMAAQSTGVAVINFKRVIENLTEFKDGMKVIEDQGKASQPKVDELLAQLKKANEDIKALPETTSLKERLDMQQKALEIEALLEARTRTLRLQLDVQTGDVLRQTFDKIVLAADKLAAKDGWDMILIDDRGVKPPERLPKGEDGKDGRRLRSDEVMSIIQQRTILSASKRVDVTDSLVELMNSEFKNPPKKKS